MTTSSKTKRNLHRLGTLGVALGVAVCASAATRLENPERTQPLGSLVPFVLSETNLAEGNVKPTTMVYERDTKVFRVELLSADSSGRRR